MIFALIPVFNEEDNISPLIFSLDAALKKIGENYCLIFVNDGSTDGTAEIVRNHIEQYPLEMLENNPNQGAGASFEKGFHHFIGNANDRDIIITMEGDNTCDLTILPEILAAIREGKDFVLASCYARRGKLIDCPLERRFFSMAANLLCRILFRVKGARTYSAFYRGFSYNTIKELYSLHNGRVITEKGFVCMVELLLKLYHAGFKFSEIPCTLHFDKRLGSSKLKITQTIKSYLQLFFSYFFSQKSYARTRKSISDSNNSGDGLQ